MENNLNISFTKVQEALVLFFGNDAPALVDISDKFAEEILEKISEVNFKVQKHLIKYYELLCSYLKTLI